LADRKEEDMRKRAIPVGIIALTLVASAAVWAGSAQGDDDERLRIRGAGTSIVEGGTGAPDFVPVITKFGFHWNGKSGDLECLALAPSAPADDPGSGNFDVNAMYVTGPITSARRQGSTVEFEGTATVTGIGAGTDVPFVGVATRGGPGTTFVLDVSGLTFKEIILEGQISF
jgi:hypothetical protein